MDADPELDAPLRRHISVALGHRPLELDCATHRIDDALEFDQQTVARGLDEAAAVLGYLRLDELAAQRFEAFERALLGLTNQPRIPRHISGQYRCQPALDALSAHLRLTPPVGQPGESR